MKRNRDVQPASRRTNHWKAIALFSILALSVFSLSGGVRRQSAPLAATVEVAVPRCLCPDCAAEAPDEPGCMTMQYYKWESGTCEHCGRVFGDMFGGTKTFLLT